MRCLLAILIFVTGGSAFAQAEHTLVRRITVFPLRVSPELSAAGEEAWWKVRELLTDNKRFLVASKNFLIQKDVFKARGELTAADAIILGKLLDANALITIFLDGRTLKMRVYENDYGRLLWQNDMDLVASVPLSQQLLNGATKLTNLFISSIPYHGFVIIDPMEGQAVYKDGEKSFVKADVGTTVKVNVGDSVQLVRLFSDSLKPLFSPETVVEVFGEGKIMSVDRGLITVEVSRLSKNIPVRELTLVRLPAEVHAPEQNGISEGLRGQINAEYYSPEMNPTQQAIAEKRPLVAALTFIANIAAFLVLAF